MEKKLTSTQIAKMMDISLLQPQFTRDDVDELIDQAIKYNMASVCVKGYDVAYSAKRLQGTDVLVGSTCAFPHGGAPTKAKVYEALTNIEDGAKEVDMVLPIGLIRSGLYDYAANELELMAVACHSHGAILKVIFENAYLTREEIIKCCELCNKAGADFVKTSTGYGPYGARVEDIALMREYADERVQVKAAGGIRTLEDVMKLYEAGATRIGTRGAAAIIDEASALGW